MRAKKDVLKQELQDIWLLVFGEPPVIDADPVLMAMIIKEHFRTDAQVCRVPDAGTGRRPLELHQSPE